MLSIYERRPRSTTRHEIKLLGEAATHVSDELKQASPDVPWREIIGIRVLLAHAYFHMDRDIVGGVVTRELPGLKSRLEELVEHLSQ